MMVVVLPAGTWTPTEAAAHVTEAYEKSVLAVIETGRRLLDAKDRVEHGAWLDCVALLPFSERTAQMFMRIALNPELSNPQRVADLPASWGTLSLAHHSCNEDKGALSVAS